MYNENQSNKLTGKDLISIGIYSAIYFVISMIGMVLAMIPAMWIAMPGVIAILAGIPYMLLCSKVKKVGVPLIMGGITALLYFLTSQFTIVILVAFLVGCILAEIARWKTKYSSFKGNAVSFIFFSFGMVGSPLPIWLFKDSFFSQIASQGMPDEYINSLQSMCSNTMLIVLLLTPVIGGIIGSFIAKLMFRKHFEKAGII
ncbi:MAG: MptD family putative ECF transporter S component [Clostridiaceae bacterium]|nr:MptD family putative ECF transporter S component [Clostridiaceae bacterium]